KWIRNGLDGRCVLQREQAFNSGQAFLALGSRWHHVIRRQQAAASSDGGQQDDARIIFHGVPSNSTLIDATIISARDASLEATCLVMEMFRKRQRCCACSKR